MKWSQYLDDDLWALLQKQAEARKMTVAKLIQFTVIPDWLKDNKSGGDPIKGRNYH